MKIAIADTDRVRSSMAMRLSLQHKMVAPNIELAKVALIKQQQNLVCDACLHDDITHKPDILRATLNKHEAYEDDDDLVMANRCTEAFADAANKAYTCDLCGSDS